jgi:hypothetical protein
MAKYQKRRVLLRKGEQSRELSLEHGHVFDTNERGSYIGYPLYDEKNELAKFDELLTRHQNDGFRIVEDTGLSAAKIHAPKKPDGMDNRTWKWVQEADEILHQWADDDYDNHKDAILDCRDMLGKIPGGLETRAEKLKKMLTKAVKELRELAEEDPAVA